ncbi:hypothetical protein EVAR_20270_1 [Eumeta japonica]|uniref:Uncharacterized protein n=1 Tax=Eumeta variegata TaxID=151549 RepID=A0A4C1VPN9_EUMVA|nr:hypothetical protein EVAR_20270_1 [Eumeta japonica]
MSQLTCLGWLGNPLFGRRRACVIVWRALNAVGPSGRTYFVDKGRSNWCGLGNSSDRRRNDSKAIAGAGVLGSYPSRSTSATPCLQSSFPSVSFMSRFYKQMNG